MQKKNLFLGLLILGTAFWGISFPVTKMAMGNFSQTTFLFYRFLAATIVLAVVFFKYVKNANRTVIASGAALAIPLVFGIQLQTLGIKHTSASQCAFVAGMSVVIIPVLKMAFYKTSVLPRIWLAAIIALAGLFVISIKENFTINIGDIYTIIGAFGFAVYLIQVEKYARSKEILPVIVPMFATCTLVTFCLALIDTSANWFPQNNTFWFGTIFCALFSTAYMYTVSNLSQKYISAERVAIIYLFEPVFAAIAAFLLLGENLTWRLFAGGSLIIIATLIAEMKIKKPASR